MTQALNTQDRDFLERTVALARENILKHGGGPFGALLVKDGVLVAEAANQVVPTCDPTAHAEVQAIRKAALALKTPHLTGCTLYSSCEPCPMCLSAAYWAHVDRIVFALGRSDAERMGFSDAEIYEEVARPAGARRIRCEAVSIPAGEALISTWNGLAGRTQY